MVIGLFIMIYLCPRVLFNPVYVQQLPVNSSMALKIAKKCLQNLFMSSNIMCINSYKSRDQTKVIKPSPELVYKIIIDFTLKSLKSLCASWVLFKRGLEKLMHPPSLCWCRPYSALHEVVMIIMSQHDNNHVTI